MLAGASRDRGLSVMPQSGWSPWCRKSLFRRDVETNTRDACATLPRKISSDGEFPQGDFYAQGNLALFAPVLRDAANRAEVEYELPMGDRRSCVAHPLTFLFALRRSFRADQLR